MGRKRPELTERQQGMVWRAIQKLTAEHLDRQKRQEQEYKRERRRLQNMLDSGVVTQTIDNYI